MKFWQIDAMLKYIVGLRVLNKVLENETPVANSCNFCQDLFRHKANTSLEKPVVQLVDVHVLDWG